MLAQQPADSLAARAAGPAVFADLLHRHERAVHAYLARRTGHRDADDLLSEVWLRAFEARSRYDHRWPDARPWLYGIARNVLRSHWRCLSTPVPAIWPESSDPWPDVDARIDAAAQISAQPDLARAPGAPGGSARAVPPARQHRGREADVRAQAELPRAPPWPAGHRASALRRRLLPAGALDHRPQRAAPCQGHLDLLRNAAVGNRGDKHDGRLAHRRGPAQGLPCRRILATRRTRSPGRQAGDQAGPASRGLDLVARRRDLPAGQAGKHARLRLGGTPSLTNSSPRPRPAWPSSPRPYRPASPGAAESTPGPSSRLATAWRTASEAACG